MSAFEQKTPDLGFDTPVESENCLNLQAKDGASFPVPRKYAYLSGVILTALESDPTAVDIPVDVTSSILQKIVEYLLHHKGVEPPEIEKPLRSKVMSEVVAPWDAAFVDELALSRQQLYDTILASNYLGLKPLLDLGCAKVASLIKDVPVDQIKTILKPIDATATKASD